MTDDLDVVEPIDRPRDAVTLVGLVVTFAVGLTIGLLWVVLT